MTFLPIIGRELRVAARRSHTYWIRFAGALAAMGVGVFVWSIVMEGRPEHARGHALFVTITSLAFVYSFLIGLFVTSDCLSQEKRLGTLGLLFLTDLNGYDVVLGKLASTSLNSLYQLFAIFPILAIPLILGGLTPAEVGRGALVLTNTLLFSLSAGVLASSLVVRERWAIVVTLFLLVGATAGPPLIELVSAAAQHRSYRQTWLYSSAVYPLVLTPEAVYKANPAGFWSSVGVTQALAWLFLFTASRWVRRAWQDRPASGPAARWRQRWTDWKLGHGPQRLAFRRRLLEANPILWQTSRNRSHQLSLVLGLILVGLIWLSMTFVFGRSMADPTVYFFIIYSLHLTLKLWMAAFASSALLEDRRSGALDMVLATPLSVDELLDGQLLGLKRLFTLPVVLVLAADLAMISAGAWNRVLESSIDWLFHCLGLLVVLLADLYALAWVGLWTGLTSGKATRAIAVNLSRVLLLPWATFLAGLLFLGLIRWRGLDEVTETGLLLTASIIALGNDGLQIAWARTNLRTRFRETALRTPASAPAAEANSVPRADLAAAVKVGS